MGARELIGRAVYIVLQPFAGVLLKGSRRAYVVLRYKDKILVVKNVIGAGKWHLPGGGCHGGESYAQAAARELKEEVGVAVESSELQPLSTQIFRSTRNFEYQLFLLPVTDNIELRLDRIEILEAAWIHPAELQHANAGESTLVAVRALSKLI